MMALTQAGHRGTASVEWAMGRCTTILLQAALMVGGMTAARVTAAPIAVAAGAGGAAASSVLSGYPATRAVDDSGWNPVTDYVSTNFNDSWISSSSTPQWLQVNFAAPSTVSSLKFWGFNQGDSFVARSVREATLSYSTDNGGSWTPIGTYTFRPATGTTTYGPDIRTFAPVANVTSMRLSNMLNYGETYTGVAEAKFYTETLADNTPEKILPNGIITGVTASASTRYDAQRDPMGIVGGIGLTSFSDPSATHYGGWSACRWLSNGTTVGNQWLRFDLGQELFLTKLRLWNCNDDQGVSRSITSLSIYTSATGTGDPLSAPGQWTLFRAGQALAAGANNSAVAGQDVLLDGIPKTQFLAFAGLVNNGSAYVGLSEVQFYGYIPEPASLSLLAVAALVLVRRR